MNDFKYTLLFLKGMTCSLKKKIALISLVFIIVIEFYILVFIVDDERSTLVNTTGELFFNKKNKKRDLLKIDDKNNEKAEVFIPVDTILQIPELPNGCEITSVTSLLTFYNYDVTKTEMSDKYLPKQPFHRINSKLYGASPYEAYAGDPRDNNGFFTYAPPIVEAANRYITEVSGEEVAKDISGSSRETIMEYVDQGIPVVVWMTRDLSPPKIEYSWYFHETEEIFNAPINLHSVVLNGYNDKEVFVMDPLKGQTTYNADLFFENYSALGSHAMTIVENSK